MTQKLTNKPIAIAADHRGFPLKEHIKNWLQANGYAVNDCGTSSPAERVDAMDYALKLVREIKQGRSDFVIGICGDGQTMAMTANRFPFMRAVLENHVANTVMGREHHNANMLAIPDNFISHDEAAQVVEAFLTTMPISDDPRYAARREKLARLNIEEI